MNSSLAFIENDGSYTYTVATTDRTYRATGGSVVIQNTTLALSENVLFSRVTYAVRFNETGLPSGTNWSVQLDGDNASSVKNSITLGEPNGTYAYHLAVVPGWTTANFSGHLMVDGASWSETVAWTRTIYTVALEEAGLPDLTPWWVNLTSGGSGYSTSASITFDEPNGTYAYSVATTDKSYASAGGFLVVSGPLNFQRVTFFSVTYTVAFLEVGLAAGTNWTVGLYAAQRSTPSTSITFSEPNGTYPFLVSSVPGYTSSLSSGIVTVGGTNTTITIDFAAKASTTYIVAFSEAGLPSGTAWSVTFLGTTVSGRGDLTIPGVGNGTYAFSVDGVPGYSATPPNGSLTVNGQGVLKAISFAQTPSSSPATFLGLPAMEGYGVLGGLIISILVVVAVAVRLRRRGGKTSSESTKQDASDSP